jgi:S1-C subfamily serine protease
MGSLLAAMAVTEDPKLAQRARDTARGLREVALGTERRIGLWILPLFLMTGLLGATLAGTLAILYYGQQVSRLESTTAAVRDQLDEAVEDVTATAATATEEIEDSVRRFQESLATGSPIESPAEAGVYAVSADHDGGEVRAGSAFTLFSDASSTFLVTTYRLVARDDGGAVTGVDVYAPEGTFTARLHNFDRDLDLAVLVLRGGPVPVLDWRPADEPVTRGDRIYLAGIAGPGTAAVLEGRVAGISDRAVVPALPVNAFVAGGPLLDSAGRVVAIASLGYAPFGSVEGDLTYGVPIRRLCDRLIRCTAEDVGGLGDEGGSGGAPAEAPPEEDAEAGGEDGADEPPPPDGGEIEAGS